MKAHLPEPQRPDNGGVSGTGYWVPRCSLGNSLCPQTILYPLFAARLPGPFTLCVLSLFHQSGTLWNPLRALLFRFTVFRVQLLRESIRRLPRLVKCEVDKNNRHGRMVRVYSSRSPCTAGSVMFGKRCLFSPLTPGADRAIQTTLAFQCERTSRREGVAP